MMSVVGKSTCSGLKKGLYIKAIGEDNFELVTPYSAMEPLPPANH